jgi:hypothetical protein
VIPRWLAIALAGAYVTAALVASYVIADAGPWWLPGATVYAMIGLTGLASWVVWRRDNELVGR